MTDLPPPPPTHGTTQFPQPETLLELSSWWRRALAAALDLALLAGLGVGGGFALAAAGVNLFVFVVLVWCMLVVQAFYEVAMIAKNKGQTLGKMAFGVRVIHNRSRLELGWRTARARWGTRFALTFAVRIATGFGPILTVAGLVLLVAFYLAPLWDENNQTWYDKSADTMVVRA